MYTQLQIFNNPQFGEVRVAGTSEQPLFCLTDVCKALDIKNPSRVANEMLDDDLRQTYPITDTLGREQSATFINESGLYTVILRSERPEAKLFRKWVTSEVLPTIRKHGIYATASTVEAMLSDPDTTIKILQSLKEERQRRQLAESKASLLEEVTREQAPKVLFANAVETSKKSCLVGELAKVLKQNGVEIGQNRLFEWLRQNGYLCSKGEAYNQPTQKAMDVKLFELKKTTINKPDGSILISTTVKVTGKGQIYFVNKFLSENVA